MEHSPYRKANSRPARQEISSFMEPDISLSCSQEPATGPYPQPDETSPHSHIILVKDPFYTILPPTPGRKRSLPLRFSSHNFVYNKIPYMRATCPRPSRHP
jgi:hypothetical protein